MLEGTEEERAGSLLGTERRPRRLKLVSEGESSTMGYVIELRIYSKIPKYQFRICSRSTEYFKQGAEVI